MSQATADLVSHLSDFFATAFFAGVLVGLLAQIARGRR